MGVLRFRPTAAAARATAALGLALLLMAAAASTSGATGADDALPSTTETTATIEAPSASSTTTSSTVTTEVSLPPAPPTTAAVDPPSEAAPGPGAESHEQPYDLLVNGRPFHGEGSPLLEGCTMTVALSGVEDGPHQVGVTISLTDPSGSAEVASASDGFTGSAWEQSFPLDVALAAVEPHGNGHHLVVQVVLDGDTTTSRPFWLACGADQGGNPFHVTLQKEWRDLLTGAVVPVPGSLDRSTYLLEAYSERGSARCTYPEGSEVLSCTYENTHGHEPETSWLVVPAGRHATFTVSERGLPPGYEAQSGLGTFVARDVCPGGPGGPGHGEESGDAEVGAEDHDRACPRLVVNVGSEQTSPTVTSTPPPAVAGETVPGASAPSAEALTTLPRTGSPTLLLGMLGVALIAAGVALEVRARAHDRREAPAP